MFDSSEEKNQLFADIDSYLKDPDRLVANDGSNYTLMTSEELDAIIMALARGRGDDGFTEEEAIAVIRWAELIRVGEAMLQNVLEGFCDIDWQNDDVLLKISEEGKETLGGYLQDG